MLREKILNFLQWNDGNGCYTDLNCIEEGLQPFTMIEATKYFIYVFAEGELDDMAWYEIDIKNTLGWYPNIKKALNILINNNDCVETYKKAIVDSIT